MEFSRIEDEKVYIKGAEQDKQDILSSVREFGAAYPDEIGNITEYDAGQIVALRIEVSESMLIIPLRDFKILHSSFGAMLSLGFSGDEFPMSEQRFSETYKTLRVIGKKLMEEENARNNEQ